MEKLAFIDTLFKPRKQPQGAYEALFATDQNEAAKLEDQPRQDSTTSSKLGSISSEKDVDKSESMYQRFKGKLSSSASSLKESVTGAMEVKKHWGYFTLFILAAAAAFFMAFSMLPMILISPGKFTLFFTLGSICVMCGLAMLRNPLNYLKSLFQKERIVVSSIYILSLLLGLYASLISGGYLLTVIALVVEFMALMWFVIGDIPGGKSGLKGLTSLSFRAFKTLGVGVFSKGRSLLPL